MLSGRYKRLGPLIFFFSLLLVSFPFFTDNIVVAEIDGDEYICDFNDFVDGTDNFILEESGNGTQWITASSTTVNSALGVHSWNVCSNEKVYWLAHHTTGETLNQTFVLSNTNISEMSMYYGWYCTSVNSRITQYVYFNNTLDECFFYLKVTKSTYMCYVYLHVYNGSGVLLHTVSGMQPQMKVDIDFDLINNDLTANFYTRYVDCSEVFHFSEHIDMDTNVELETIDFYNDIDVAGIGFWVDDLEITAEPDGGGTEIYFDIICDYDNSSDCIKWQSFLDFYVEASYPTGIYYRVVNCTNDVIMDGLRYAPLLLHHVTGVPIWREEWEDCAYGLIRVMSIADYINNNYQFSSDLSTDYGFCVDSYVPEGYYLNTKSSYDDGEGVDISWQAPLNEVVDIKILQVYNDNYIIWNMSYTGTGSIENAIDVIPARKYYDSDGHITGYHLVYMYNHTTGSKIPGVWDSYTVESSVAFTWEIYRRIVPQYGSQYAQGVHNFDGDVYLEFILPSGEVHSRWEWPAGIPSRFNIQCDFVGEWDAIVYLNGNQYDHKNFSVVSSSSWQPNAEEFGEYAVYIGLMVCLCIGAFAGYLTLSGIAFTGGFFGTMLILSVPGQPFTMFPPIFLFVIGVILFLAFLNVAVR